MGAAGSSSVLSGATSAQTPCVVGAGGDVGALLNNVAGVLTVDGEDVAVALVAGAVVAADAGVVPGAVDVSVDLLVVVVSCNDTDWFG